MVSGWEAVLHHGRCGKGIAHGIAAARTSTIARGRYAAAAAGPAAELPKPSPVAQKRLESDVDSPRYRDFGAGIIEKKAGLSCTGDFQ